MADRVSASITIGGTLPASQLPAFAEAIANEGLSTEWDGEPFALGDLPEGEPLALMAHETSRRQHHLLKDASNCSLNISLSTHTLI